MLTTWDPKGRSSFISIGCEMLKSLPLYWPYWFPLHLRPLLSCFLSCLNFSLRSLLTRLHVTSDTSRPPIRQGGREMSAPRPCETYPFYPPALFLLIIRSIYVYIQNCLNYYLHVVFTLYICYLLMRSSTTTYSKVERHFEVILSSMWYVLVRDNANKYCWHSYHSNLQEKTALNTH